LCCSSPALLRLSRGRVPSSGPRQSAKDVPCGRCVAASRSSTMLGVRQLNNAYEVCTELRIPRPPDVSTSVEGRRLIFFPVAVLYSSALSSSSSSCPARKRPPGTRQERNRVGGRLKWERAYRMSRKALCPRRAVAPQHARAHASTRSSWSPSRQCS
jgi:hypothetical protein